MKAILSIVILSTTLVSTAAFARTPRITNKYDCGNNRQEWYSEYVYLNSPDEYNGPGYIDSCKEASATAGPSKAGSYFLCHVSID